MKRNLLNFTRGSQLLGHFGFMFAAGLKGPLIVTLLLAAWLSYWEVTTSLSDYQVYLVWMHVYAAGYGFMEFDPGKLVELKLAGGGTLRVPMNVVHQFPPMREAVAAFFTAIRRSAGLAALILVPAFAAFWWFAERFGGKSKERKHERGAMLVTLDALETEIASYNRAERARELGAAMGWRWRLAGQAELRAAGHYSPAHLAGIPWPWRLEQSHTMLIGTTGTGKTVALSQLVAEARERGQRAVIFDLTGAFIEAFYDAKRDVILNPLDARCPTWSVFNDCTSEGEFHAAAEALVPHDGGGSEQFWVLAARMLFVEMCLHLQRAGQPTNQALASRLMTADLAQVHKLMRGTMADPLTAPEAARMAESIRAVFNANAKALKLLPTEGDRFSVRDWTRGDCKPGSILFLSARYVDMSICSQLLTLWLDTAMNTLMTLERTPELRLWFLIDELGALHRLPALEKGLQTARNFGGAIVTGVHAFAKLKEVYGENMAMTLSSLARTKLILATADRETATWCSDFIGHRQVRDMEEGYSYGYNNARDAVSLTPRRQIEPLLLPDQFMNLPRLSGYLKFPDGFPAAPVSLIPRSQARIAEGFIARDKLQAKPGKGSPPVPTPNGKPGSAESGEHPAANDDGAGRAVDAKQLKLDLAGDIRAQSDARSQAAAQEGRIDDALMALAPSTIETSGDSAIVAAEQWLSLSSPDRAKTAIYASGRVLRSAVNEAVQRGLKANGELGPKAARLNVHARVNATREELRHLGAYQPGMVLVFRSWDGTQRLSAGDYTVKSIDYARKQLELEDGRGRVHRFSPSRLRPGADADRLSLFERKSLVIFEGERIRWTENDHKRALFNADQAKVVAIDAKGVTVETSANKELRLSRRDPMLKHLDLAYALNAHMAQGLTSDRGIAVMDSRERNLANQRTFLVTVTRLRDHLTLVVDSAAKLGKAAAQNTGDKTSALEVTERLRSAAAKGQASRVSANESPAKQPPELTKERVKPFEMGI